MKISEIFCKWWEFLKARVFLISWISLVLYLFYDTFIYYKYRQQFYYLRRILGLGLCVSRGTATVLNLCCALVLLPLCKKLNQILYRLMSKVWPGLFFFWLEKAKSCHMTVAVTLLIFAVIHSVSHFVNLWNFSRGYDEEWVEINIAKYRNENPLVLLMSLAGMSGVCMLFIILCMGMTSLRVVRRKMYNAFWYTHRLYLLFLILFIIHPLSGVLKEQILEDETSQYINKVDMNWINTTTSSPIRFTPIKSKRQTNLFKYYQNLSNKFYDLLPYFMINMTFSVWSELRHFSSLFHEGWLWISVPVCCFFLDLFWRILTRNRAEAEILEVNQMPGRMISLMMSCPHERFVCRAGQYVLLQCLDVSMIEWHPFTVVKVPTKYQRNFIVWIRVKGDWTEALEKLVIEKRYNKMSVLVDGPFSSPMESVVRNQISICVAAGVGITPFVAMLHQILINPRNRLPGRVHLLWIVRHEKELTWLAEIANKTMLKLRDENRPDRLHLELHVTSKSNPGSNHVIIVNEKGSSRLQEKVLADDERVTLLTPNRKRAVYNKNYDDDNYEIAKEYPLLACRVRRGRPHWDRVFGYWVHLYPEEHLNLYCCGPKKLVKLLRKKCKDTSTKSKTKFTFIHEGFS